MHPFGDGRPLVGDRRSDACQPLCDSPDRRRTLQLSLSGRFHGISGTGPRPAVCANYMAAVGLHRATGSALVADRTTDIDVLVRRFEDVPVGDHATGASLHQYAWTTIVRYARSQADTHPTTRPGSAPWLSAGPALGRTGSTDGEPEDFLLVHTPIASWRNGGAYFRHAIPGSNGGLTHIKPARRKERRICGLPYF